MLLRATDPKTGASRLLVRGDARAAYHDNILQRTRKQLEPTGLQLRPCGGGRIEHHPERRSVSVYGFSSAFGQAPHHVTAELLRRALPLYDHGCGPGEGGAVAVSYTGY